VLIDSAGRYTTQDSNSTGSTRRPGLAVLRMLKSTRRRQPLNGVLGGDQACLIWASLSDVERVAHATAIRPAHPRAAR